MMCKITFILLAVLQFYSFLYADTHDINKKAESLHFTGDLRWDIETETITAENGISAEYMDIKIIADKMNGSLKTKKVSFSGNVKLSNNNGTIYGNQLVYDMETDDWQFEKGKGELLPVLFSKYLSDSLFVNADELQNEDNIITSRSGSFTTCNLDHPHYSFNAREIIIYPGVKIIAHDASMYILDKKLFNIGSIIIPIRKTDINLLPQIGSSEEEGYFLKISYPYNVSRNKTGILKLDLMSAKGIGIGVNQSYNNKNINGIASIYYLNDRSINGTNITGNLKHKQKIDNVNLDFTSNYRLNSYLYYPDYKYFDTQLMLNNSSKKSTYDLSFRRSVNRGSSKNIDDSIILRQTQRFNDNLRSNITLDYRSHKYTGMSVTDKELETNFELLHQTDKYDLRLNANKRIDLDGDDYTNDDQFNGLEKLPELTYETDSYRKEKSTFLDIPYRFAASIGHYHEMPLNISKNRLLLQFDVPQKSINIGSANQIDLSGGYRQAFYGNDMAQYVLKFKGLLTTRYSDYLKSRIGWNYQRSYGYSPFMFDYTGKYNYSKATFDYQENNVLRLSLSTGYNFNNTKYPWQDIALRMTAFPQKQFSYSISGGYNINKGEWKTLTNQIRINTPGKIIFELGTKYDIENGEVDIMRGKLDLRINKKWRIEGIAGWNGQSNDYEYKAVRLTRDLHCWEASITYTDEMGFRKDKGISLEFRIKAFPYNDRFGIGQYGQLVDTSMGEYFN